MSKFIVDLWLDGYEDEKEAEKACEDFIYDQLNFTASSVKIEKIDDSFTNARHAELVEIAKEMSEALEHSKNRLEFIASRSVRDHDVIPGNGWWESDISINKNKEAITRFSEWEKIL